MGDAGVRARDERIAEWDAQADSFDEEADHGLSDPEVREAWRDLLLGVLPAAPARVADLGCGTGTLGLLLAEEGYTVDGIDFSPAMVERARAKAAETSGTGGAGDRCSFVVSDAASPRLERFAYDVVLCRHVLWAMPDPAVALARWLRLLTPGGRLVLVEGRWSNGAGLSAEQTVRLVEDTGRTAAVTRLDDPAYWGRSIDDDRYVVVSPAGG